MKKNSAVRQSPKRGYCLKCAFKKNQRALAIRDNENMPSDRASLLALRDLIADTDLTLETIPELPQNRTAHCRENLRAALVLAEDLIKQQRMTPAAVLGHKGGSSTARKLGAEHYRRMAAARKSHGGGRPRKA